MEKKKTNQQAEKKKEDSSTIARIGQMYSKPWDEELLLVTSIFIPEDPMAKIRQTARLTTGGAY